MVRSNMLCSLVVIPGVGTPTPHLWADGSQECWLRTIKFDKVTPEHFTAAYFDHDLLPNDKFSWQALLSQSSRLLDELSTLHESKEVCHTPKLTLHSGW
jgi:hypothetical protein